MWDMCTDPQVSADTLGGCASKTLLSAQKCPVLVFGEVRQVPADTRGCVQDTPSVVGQSLTCQSWAAPRGDDCR